MAKPILPIRGVILYEGPSQFDNSPIVAIATNIDFPSQNVKTGPMVQTWIMRSDIDPVLARKQNMDISICGDCQHRSGSCYVNLSYSPLNIYKTYKDNRTYKRKFNFSIFKHKLVRIGSYGDPTAVPFEVWQNLIEVALEFTGYTHQWATCDQRFRHICMASIDNIDDMQYAHDLGWSTFRVKQQDETTKHYETTCLASQEKGFITNCASCLMCNPKNNRNIAVTVHGTNSKKFLGLPNSNVGPTYDRSKSSSFVSLPRIEKSINQKSLQGISQTL